VWEYLLLLLPLTTKRQQRGGNPVRVDSPCDGKGVSSHESSRWPFQMYQGGDSVVGIAPPPADDAARYRGRQAHPPLAVWPPERGGGHVMGRGAVRHGRPRRSCRTSRAGSAIFGPDAAVAQAGAQWHWSEVGPAPRKLTPPGRALSSLGGSNAQKSLIDRWSSVIPTDLMRARQRERPFDRAGGRPVPCPEEISPC
jgi:hypothetical protein